LNDNTGVFPENHGDLAGSVLPADVPAAIQIAVKFRICGSLRFLSHAETVRLFQRACERAGIKTVYSHGFNPRPKLSLPLPRSVGVETDEDLLCLRLHNLTFDIEDFKAKLSAQLPQGCELLTIRVAKSKKSIQPCMAAYVLMVQGEYFDEKLKATIKHVLASEKLVLKRRIDAEGTTRNVEVRGFINTIEVDRENVTVECKISPAGTIRVDEILELLQLDHKMLAAPVRRTSVKWQEE